MNHEQFCAAVDREMKQIGDMLKLKNQRYGNSALEPVRIFSKTDPVEQLRVRIDDKLSRLVRGEDGGEDVVQDLVGYLIMLRIAQSERRPDDHVVRVELTPRAEKMIGSAPFIECTCAKGEPCSGCPRGLKLIPDNRG